MSKTNCTFPWYWRNPADPLSFTIPYFLSVVHNPVNSKAFASALIRTSGKKGITRRIPNFAIKWMMGEMSALMLESQHVSNQKIKKAGFRFVHKEIFETLRGMKEEQ